MRSGSKTISTASAWPGWFRYVGLSLSPPVYPTRVEMTPSRLRSSSCTPQKQPPARMAVSVLSFMVSSSSELSYPAQQGLGTGLSRTLLAGDLVANRGVRGLDVACLGEHFLD